MRSAIALLICFLALSSATQTLKVNTDDVILVIKGVVEGMGLAEHWTDVAPCIAESEDAAENLAAAIEYFKKEDSIDVARGLAALGKALEDLPNSLHECGSAVEDVERLVKSLAAISSPTTFFFHAFKNLLINGVEIYNEIYTAVNDTETNQWEDFGKNVGEALTQIFLYGTVHLNSVATPAKDALLFLEGVIEGISTDSNFSDFSACLYDVEGVATQLDQAINDFVAQDAESVIAGIKLLANVLQALPVALHDCENSFSEFDGLVQAIEALKNPFSLAYHISRSLVVNGHEIWHNVVAAVAFFRNGSYENSGKAIGTILVDMIHPEQKKLNSNFARFVKQRVGFEVDVNNKFTNWTVGEIKGLLGAEVGDLSGIPGVDHNYDGLELPVNFTSFDKWPQCKNPILDQAQCGSCWAFSAAETLSDRFCIASAGQIKVQLSPQYLISCSDINFGCSGGMLTNAWLSMQHGGLPTLECQAYQSGEGDVPSCSYTCDDGSAMKSYYASAWSVRWYMSVNSIKTEIMTNGPVQTGFTVYEDFMNYKSGVYKHTTGAELGGHAVKIVGWGNEDGQDYWLVANSWGPDWGLEGYFKIALGDCGIDSTAVAGKADVAAASMKKSAILDF